MIDKEILYVAGLLFSFLIFVVAVFLIITLITRFARPLIYLFSPLFFSLNIFLWFISNPLRYYWKDTKKGGSRGVWLFLSVTGIGFLWWCFIYFLSFPLRLVIAIYYDLILYLTVSISDNIDELLIPKLGKIKHKKGVSYIAYYLITIPFRLAKFAFSNLFYFLDSFLMLGISIVFPTYTMYHGTKFNEAATKISQSGTWRVGSGNHVGTGIYFGITERTAKHYAPSGEDMGIIISRVTLSFCKTISTMKKEHRDMVGNGEILAQQTKGIFRSIEHWRDGNSGWWEYCLLKPKQMGSLIKSWRLRPVAVTKNGKITRLYGGFSHYSLHIPSVIAGLFSWWFIYTLLELNYS